MGRTKSQYVRLLALDRLIRDGKYPNSASFSTEWEVSEKTVLRDIEYLRDRHHAPIIYDREKRGYYYESPNYYLPALTITEGEALALLVSAQAAHMFEGAPLAEHLGQITQRIMESLPANMNIPPEELFSGLTFTTAALRTLKPDVWTTFVRALTDQWVVIAHMETNPHDPRNGTLRLQPLHIANIRGDWYIFARIEPDSAIEQFPLSRFSSAECSDVTFERNCSINFKDAIDKSFRKAVFFDNPHEWNVKLRFVPVLADVITARTYAPNQKCTLNPDKTLDMEFVTHSLAEVLWFVLEWGHGCTVMEPPELIEMVMDEFEKMANQYPKRPVLTPEQKKLVEDIYPRTEARL